MNTREMTKADVGALVADARSRQVGDYVEPLVFSGTDTEREARRRHLRVTHRLESSASDHWPASVRYRCVDRDGISYDVFPMDDPRPSTREEFEAGS